MATGLPRIHEAWSHLNFRYEAKLKTVSIVDLSGKQNLARDRRYFNGCAKNLGRPLQDIFFLHFSLVGFKRGHIQECFSEGF